MRLTFLLLALFVAGCGNDEDLPPMLGTGTTDDARAEAQFQKAKAEEDAGKTKKAIKLYDELADELTYTDRAAEARFRQARLLEKRGDTLDAFEAYQNLLSKRAGSGFYEQAFERQTELAFAAADGEIKNNFLGIKSRLGTDKVVTMLKQVADNAPRSPVAAKAEYRIGDLYVEQEKIEEAVRAFRDVVEGYPTTPEAPEAQFHIGEILLNSAREGNQDQANLHQAEEAFRDYLSQFPNHGKTEEARKLLKSINTRDLKNSYDIARFYEKKGNLDSARFYYKEVIRRTSSGKLRDQAQARLDKLKSE